MWTCVSPGHQARTDLLPIWRCVRVCRGECLWITLFLELLRMCLYLMTSLAGCCVLWPITRQFDDRRHTVFVFTVPISFLLQINSDVVFHSRRKDGTLEPVRVNRTHVGRLVLTKSPGDVTRRDITDQYKFAEGQGLHRTQMSVFQEVADLFSVLEPELRMPR